MARRENDWYPTPSWATQELLTAVPISGTVCEPCVGDWAIARPLALAGLTVITNDIDHAHVADSYCDARDPDFWAPHAGIEWVITNPPFNDADRILPLARSHAESVAMLLRLSYLEPCAGRARWLTHHPPDALIVLPRMSFTGDGKTDSVTCAWMIWSAVVAQRGLQPIRIIPRRDARQQALLSEERHDDSVVTTANGD